MVELAHLSTVRTMGDLRPLGLSFSIAFLYVLGEPCEIALFFWGGGGGWSCNNNVTFNSQLSGQSTTRWPILCEICLIWLASELLLLLPACLCVCHSGFSHLLLHSKNNLIWMKPSGLDILLTMLFYVNKIQILEVIVLWYLVLWYTWRSVHIYSYKISQYHKR